jgi:hypothetical protein
MWIFFREGYVSVVQHKDDALSVLVRARRHEHLVAFFNSISRSINPANIIELPSADYKYRIVVPREVFVKALEEKAACIDYTSFKKSITDKILKRAALDIWQILWEAYHKYVHTLVRRFR